MNDHEPLPDWLSSNLKRAAFRSALGQTPPLIAVLLLLAGVNLVWALGEAESVFVPLIWNAVFLAMLYFIGKDFARDVRDWARPEGSAEIAYLRRAGSLSAAVDRLTAELADPANVRIGREATFTRSFLVISRGARFFVRRLDDLVWVYPKQTTTKLNYVIPLGRSYRAIVCAAGAPEAEAKCSKDESLAFTAHAQKVCPWIVAGFSEDARVRWDGDRERFAASVLARRAKP